MKLYISTLLLIFVFGSVSAQTTEKFSKVKINLIGHEHSELARLGLECDHGEIAPHKHIINVYSDTELKLLDEAGFEYAILIDDVKAFYKQYGTDDHRAVNIESREEPCEAQEKIYDYVTPVNYEYGSMGGYLTYDQALVELDKMNELYPNLITERMTIGDILTHEGRNLFYMVISDDPNNIIDEEPQIYYNALHHAREPNSLSQLIFYMWYLLENYETDPEVKYLVDNTAMFFQPIVNPDGYVFNEITDPDGGGFWRKNRYANSEGSKVGVDLNRNYGFMWAFDNTGSSPNETSQTYRGESAFSEPETQATRKLSIDNNFQISLNYHTFGNLLIHPWGFNDEPTEEDYIFKSLGRTMIDENDFIVGTGSETVNYVVNGDSDDYMYGEQTEKNKSYSFTPEVGPTFWPSADRIDYFNKSSVRMNLNAAHTLLSYGTAKEIEGDENINTQQGVFRFEFEKTGLRNEPISFHIESNTPELSLSANEYPGLDMTVGETREFEVAYQLDNPIEGQEIKMTILIDNGNYIHREEITKYFTYIVSVPTEVVNDPIDNLDGFIATGNWGLSTNEFVSAPYSICDSPNGTYGNNEYSEIIVATPLDLSTASAANLKYHTKFTIERDYDYVQIQVSADGMNFTPLCGKYTNAGTADQVENGEPVYDAQVEDWVLETICLDDYIGNNEVIVKFIFQSDNFVNADGFYFDNLILETFTDLSISTTEIPMDVITVMPNPTSDFIQLSMDNHYFKDDMSFELYDLLGKKVLDGPINHPHKKLDISMLSSGTYIFRINVEDRLFSSGKVIKN